MRWDADQADIRRAQAAAAAQQQERAALDSAERAGSGRWQPPKAEDVAAEIAARRESVMPAEAPAQPSPQRLNAWQVSALIPSVRALIVHQWTNSHGGC